MESSIEIDTPILPVVVADCVIQEVVGMFANKEDMHTHPDLIALYEHRYGIADMLARKAERIYSASNHKRFTKVIRSAGNKGRDYLYMFMRHWMAGVIHSRYPGIWPYIPDGFKIGQD